MEAIDKTVEKQREDLKELKKAIEDMREGKGEGRLIRTRQGREGRKAAAPHQSNKE